MKRGDVEKFLSKSILPEFQSKGLAIPLLFRIQPDHLTLNLVLYLEIKKKLKGVYLYIVQYLNEDLKGVSTFVFFRIQSKHRTLCFVLNRKIKKEFKERVYICIMFTCSRSYCGFKGCVYCCISKGQGSKQMTC